jgi:threonine/homoserine/homoserine lactone efflux protein
LPEATLLLIFTTAFTVAFSGAMMPGPLLAITITETTRRGFWAGPRLMLGHAILEIGIVVVLASGLNAFLEHELVQPVIGLVGGTILIGIGLLTLLRLPKHAISEASSATAAKGSGKTPILAGIVGSISNPYWFIWWITLGATYLLWALTLGVPGVITFFCGHILGDLVWYCFVSFVVASGRRIINDRVYRGILAVCGVALAGLGIYFLQSAVGFFTR